VVVQPPARVVDVKKALKLDMAPSKANERLEHLLAISRNVYFWVELHRPDMFASHCSNTTISTMREHSKARWHNCNYVTMTHPDGLFEWSVHK
jgi:hypothetical protein